MEFIVVEFVGTNAIDYVPDSWLKGRNETYWPNSSEVSKLRTKFAHPDESWDLHEIVIITHAADEPSARRRCRRAVENENLSSGAERKRSLPMKFGWSNEEHDTRTSPKRKKILVPKENELAAPPGFPVTIESPVLPTRRDVGTMTNEQFVGNSQIKDWFRECFIEFGRLHEKIDHLTNLTTSQQNANCANKENNPADLIRPPTFTKLSNPDEVVEVFENLKTSFSARKEMVTLLSKQCSNLSLRSGVKNMLLLLAPPVVWMNFSKDGQRGKRGVVDMALPGVFMEALRLNGENVTEKKLHACLAELLKRMPQLISRRDEKAERKLKGKISRSVSITGTSPASPLVSDGDDSIDSN